MMFLSPSSPQNQPRPNTIRRSHNNNNDEENDDEMNGSGDHDSNQDQTKTWFDFFVHPTQLEPHLLQQEVLKPTPSELLSDFLHQIDKTEQQHSELLNSIANSQTSANTPTSSSPSTPTSTSTTTTSSTATGTTITSANSSNSSSGSSTIDASVDQSPVISEANQTLITELMNRLNRLYHLCCIIVEKCHYSLHQMTKLVPVHNQKKLLLKLMEHGNSSNSSSSSSGESGGDGVTTTTTITTVESGKNCDMYSVMFHVWILKAILGGSSGSGIGTASHRIMVRSGVGSGSSSSSSDSHGNVMNHVMNPKHELSCLTTSVNKNVAIAAEKEEEGVDSKESSVMTVAYDLNHIGENSVMYLEGWMKNNETTNDDDASSFQVRENVDMSVMIDIEEMTDLMAQFYFRIEQFSRAKQLFSLLLNRIESKSKKKPSTGAEVWSQKHVQLIKSMMSACDCIMRSESAPNLDQYRLLKRVETVLESIESGAINANSYSATNSLSSSELIDCLLMDNVVNALSLNYREQLLLTQYVSLRSESELRNKVIGCNIVKHLMSILGPASATERNEWSDESAQWEQYITSSKHLSKSSFILAYAVSYAEMTLTRLPNSSNSWRTKFGQFMIRAAELVGDAFSFAVLLYSAPEVEKASKCDRSSLEKQLNDNTSVHFLQLKKFFEGFNMAECTKFEPIPKKVFETVQSKVARLDQSAATDTDRNISATRKRKFSALVEDQHYLVSKQKKRTESVPTELYVPYLLHSARQRLFNSSTIDPLSYNHAALLLHDALSDLNQQEEMHHRTVKFDRSYEYDVILVNLAHKKSPASSHNVFSRPPTEGTPINMEEYEKLMTLLQADRNSTNNSSMAFTYEDDNQLEQSGNIVLPPLPFLTELLRLLVHLDDWMFIRDYFSVLRDNVSNKQSQLGVFFEFVMLLQNLYEFSFADQSSDNYLEDIRDLTFDMIHNLQSSGSVDSHGASSKEQKNNFYSVMGAQNMRFQLQMASILSFALCCLRRSGNKDIAIRGHYTDLAECVFSSDVRTNTPGHILPVWKGKERMIDDAVHDMLKYVLQQLVDHYSDELCTEVSNGHYYYFTLGDLCFEKKQFTQCLKHYLQIGQELLDRDRTPQQVFAIYSAHALHPMIHSLSMLGEYTAAFALHQFLPIATSNTAQQQDNPEPRILGYDKRAFTELRAFNEVDKKWLLYFWDLTYIELLVFIEHEKSDNENEKLLLQHIQRKEMNTNNPPALRRIFVERLQLELLQKLYEHVTSKQD